jgi:hypothetical protein
LFLRLSFFIIFVINKWHPSVVQLQVEKFHIYEVF